MNAVKKLGPVIVPAPSPAATKSRSEIAAEPDEPNLLLFDRNDDGNAQRLLALHGEDLRFCHAFKKWLVWDGRRWAVDSTERARRLAKLSMIEYLKQAEQSGGDDNPHTNFASASLNSGSITNMLRMAQPEIFVEPSDLDTDLWLLNFQNGTVDLRTGKLRPHAPAELMTKLVHHTYNPGAACPLWAAFLHTIMGGNRRMVAYLQRAIGYSLTGSTIEKAVFVPFGEGDNGKTTMLSTVRGLVPEYSALLDVNTLLVRNESNNTQADLADLRGARFVQTSETEDGQRLAQGKLKKISQGMGDIKAVRKYQDWITFPETHKLWMDTNRNPTITDADDRATFNRLHPIPFTVTIPKDKIDRELPAKLLAEAEGILAWAVAGAKLWYKSGLDKPAAVDRANTEWREESDHLTKFIDDRRRRGGEVAGKELFAAYRKWAESNSDRVRGMRVLSPNDFGEKMAERKGVTKKRKNRGVTYEGISLRGHRGSILAED